MDALVREYEGPVFNAALRMLGNRDDAADVTQTTFMKAFQKLGQFDTKRRFFSWIYRIALNESIDMINSHARSTPLESEGTSSEPLPEALADSDQVNQQLQAALLELSDDYRGVIVLRYFSGCSYREMAEILGIPEKTVKSRLFSARHRMRDLLVRHGVLSS